MRIFKFLLISGFIAIHCIASSQIDNWEWITKPKYQRLGEFETNLCPVKLNNQWGYINLKGEPVIDIKYDDVTKYRSNVAMVKKGLIWSLIDTSGNYLNKEKFKHPLEFSEGLAVDKVIETYGYETIEWSGFVNYDNDQIIKRKYTGARKFSEGLAPVKKMNRWGYINPENETVIDFTFYDAKPFYNERAIVKNEDFWCFINKKGEIISKDKYENLTIYSSHLAGAKKNGKWGMVNLNFETVIDYLYQDIKAYSEGLIAVKLNNLWGFIDKNGEIVIDCIYDEATSFVGDFACVKLGGKWGCINQKGKLLIEYTFDDVVYTNPEAIAIKINDTWGLGAIQCHEDKIERYVSKHLKAWEKKGRYEKTDDYYKRVNDKTRQKKAQELAQEAINKFALEEKNLRIEKVDYDADNETFKLTYKNLDPIYLNVPISEAKSFDINVDKIKYADFQFTLNQNNDYVLLHLTATNPELNKTYTYDAKDVIAYNVTKLDLKFDDVDVTINKESKPKVAETTKTISMGKSDVDVNIPVTTTINENTFAVIIGNENYEHEIKVDYAINDAEIFKTYAIKTLGIPKNQVHFIKNATIGDFMHELDWLNKIAKGFNGDAKLIFYYAGHGMPDQSTKDAFILPTDGYSSNTRTAIPLKDIYSELNEHASKSVIVLLDACFSGSSRDGMLANGRGVKIIPKEQVIQKNMIVFSAVSGDETAHPYNEKQHGLFTYYLLKKLKETKGEIKLGELETYLKSNVLKKSVILHNEQNPTVKFSNDIQNSWKEWSFK